MTDLTDETPARNMVKAAQLASETHPGWMESEWHHRFAEVVPDLLTEIDRLQERVERLEGALEEIRDAKLEWEGGPYTDYYCSKLASLCRDIARAALNEEPRDED